MEGSQVMFCFAFLTGKSLMRQDRDFLGETAAAALPSCAMTAVTPGAGTLPLRRSLLQASTQALAMEALPERTSNK